MWLSCRAMCLEFTPILSSFQGNCFVFSENIPSVYVCVYIYINATNGQMFLLIQDTECLV